MITKPKLNPSELQHSTWVQLKAYYEQRLLTLRRQNDSPKLSEEQTKTLRGRILEVKEFLAIGEPKPEMEEEPFVE